MKSRRILLLSLALSIASLSVFYMMSGIVSSDLQDDSIVVENQSTTHGYKISLSVNKSSKYATTVFENLSASSRSPVPDVIIDGYRIDQNRSFVGNDGRAKIEYDVDKYFNVSNSSHLVEIYTIGPQLQTTIHKEYDLEDPDIPATRIRDVEVVEATYNGEPTAAVDVVLENPSPRGYSAYLFAHTLETHGKKKPAVVPIRENRTVERIPLREGPDEEIEGELRLTTARLDEDRGLRDQIWFRGTTDGDTEWQREPYEPVGYQNSDDPYRYSRNDGLLASFDAPPTEYVAVGIVATFVVGLAVARRYLWA